MEWDEICNRYMLVIRLYIDGNVHYYIFFLLFFHTFFILILKSNIRMSIKTWFNSLQRDSIDRCKMTIEQVVWILNVHIITDRCVLFFSSSSYGWCFLALVLIFVCVYIFYCSFFSCCYMWARCNAVESLSIQNNLLVLQWMNSKITEWK